METQDIQITAEPQQTPEKCKFTVETPLLQGPTVFFNHAGEAVGSALAEVLFASGNVINVQISEKVIFVTQAAPEDWRIMGKRIGSAIREAIKSGKTLISKEAQEKIPPTEKIRQQVTEILAREINPAVASHGGFIELIDVKNNDIFLKMGGGCQGCASSQATLKQGVEKALRREIPELGMIYDATDHTAGENPYY